jgi:hypothetical protein
MSDECPTPEQFRRLQWWAANRTAAVFQLADAEALRAVLARLETLETENARLREALEPFAALAEVVSDWHEPDNGIVISFNHADGRERELRTEHIHAARAALSGPQPPPAPTPDPEDPPRYTPNPHAVPPPDPRTRYGGYCSLSDVLDSEGRPWDHPDYEPGT